jgi:hypothetical protein
MGLSGAVLCECRIESKPCFIERSRSVALGFIGLYDRMRGFASNSAFFAKKIVCKACLLAQQMLVSLVKVLLTFSSRGESSKLFTVA